MFRFWAVDAETSFRHFVTALMGVLVFAATHPGDAVAQDEGLVIRSLQFQGNRSIRALTLEAAISTTKSSWIARKFRFLGLGELRRLNEREFRVDVARIRLLYQLNGYLDAKVDTAVVRTEKDAYITFRIVEGEPVLVRALVVSGLDSLPDSRKVAEGLPLRVGMPFSRHLLIVSADTIQTRLWNLGYPTASVLASRREVDRMAHTADLELVADPGVKALIGSVQVNGTSAVDSAFVRSLLATRAGRLFRYSDLYRSQLNLYQSGLFRFATVGIDTTRFTFGDPTVPIVVRVQEGPLFRARAGVGIGTNDCLRSNVGWTARNVGGSGRQFDVTAQVSKLGVAVAPFNSTICHGLERDTIGSAKINYGLAASFRRPAFLSPSNALTTSVFAERRSEFLAYLRDEIGTSITFSREGARTLPVAITYRLSYGATQASPVSFCAFFLACRADDIAQLSQRRFTATLTGTVARQRVNNLVDPTRGSVYTFETTFSSPLIGSTRFSEFTRLVGEASWYRPLGGDVVLATHLRGGLIFAPRLRLQAGAANFVPPDQRFYAGGANDVRGFDRNELGPVIYVTQARNVTAGGTVNFPDSVQVAPIGGNTAVIANAEVRLPTPLLSGKLRFAAFVDAGTVWERGDTRAAAARLRFTPGIGFRFATPLGPARFDLAWKAPRAQGSLYSSLDDVLTLVRTDYQKPTTGRFNLQVSVGQAF